MNTFPNEEKWAAVVGWPQYEVSTLGNVRRNGRPISVFLVRGYPAFNVSDGLKRKSLRVHQEVARVFLPHTDGQVVRHLDGNKQNRALSNLEWGTAVENEHDKVLHGTAMRGERHHQHKLKAVQIQEIRNSTLPRAELARIYGVKYRTIYAIQKRESWQCL